MNDASNRPLLTFGFGFGFQVGADLACLSVIRSMRNTKYDVDGSLPNYWAGLGWALLADFLWPSGGSLEPAGPPGFLALSAVSVM